MRVQRSRAWNRSSIGLETLKRSRVYWLSAPCSQNRVPAQTRRSLQFTQGSRPQDLLQVLDYVTVRVFVANKRWQQCADVVVLVPPSFGLFPDQMKARSSDRVPFEQSVGVRLFSS